MRNWKRVHLELRRKSVTLQLLHMEYKEQHPDGFQYTWFTEHCKQDLTMSPYAATNVAGCSR
ncbi:MAG: hypothetical protein ACYDB4_18735 [Candidatus Dormibacteraceae bacterium]